ncbi:aspartate:alanine exchanger family transporter [Geobacter argillaceus]|uniref:Putative transport protein n=1 Tax=Geobacter argillaceus TaxID=345631 RepID=A0A562VPK9_9BACT|nr:TrkA C-terminal domain-containing protein [Geobacter argillaceus]TWJ19778.1 putative transport protein [Geobacter argillaceus]
MEHFVHFCTENPVLVVFAVIAMGYPLGRLRVGPVSLGVAGVLFAGLGAGALIPGIKPPEALHVLGLSMFVYAIGLSSGPSFVAALKSGGIRANLTALASLAAATLAAIVTGSWLGKAQSAGLYAGALTNTPALAGVSETLRNMGDELGATTAVMAYSVAYPLAVGLGTILFSLSARQFSRFFGEDPVHEELCQTAVRVDSVHAINARLGDLTAEGEWQVAFGRLTRDNIDRVAFPNERLQTGDVLTLVGAKNEVERVCAALGKPAEDASAHREGTVDVRRIFLSNRRLAGMSIEQLNLEELFGGRVTRIRRGDADMVPPPGFIVELGDRLRVVAPTARMKDVGNYLGDSYQAVGEVEMLTFALGHAMGLLLGALAVTVGGVTLKLGFAGGPLCVGLLLGSLRRTGTLVWQVPHAANMAIRQLGLVIFLAGIGLRAGGGLGTVPLGQVAGLAGASLAVTLSGIAVALFISGRWLGFSPARSCGLAAAVMTQPALLAWGQERFGCGPVDEGYATVYPLSMIAKVLLAQAILIMVR